MARVKRGRVRTKKRRNILKQAKGYKWGRKKKVKLAKTAIKKAGVYAYRDRRVKKRDKRALWQNIINAAVRPNGLSYSVFINKLKTNNIELDRKILAEIAEKEPKVFQLIVEKVK